MVHADGPLGLDGIAVEFDDERAVADAGIVLVATLAERLVVDVDSFLGEVFGRGKQGAGFGYTRVRGYHPLIATRADTGEVLHVRLRTGSANTSRGMLRFCDELIARVERAGATGPKLL